MKRILAILTVLILLLIPATAFAASKTYEIPELGMRVDIPEDLIVFSRDVEANDPNLAVLNLDEKALEQMLADNGVYLYAVSRDGSQEIAVKMAENKSTKEIYDFNAYSLRQLEKLYRQGIQSSLLENISFNENMLYKHTQAIFMRTHVSYPNTATGQGDVHGIQYITAINGMAINIALSSYTGAITPEQEKRLKDAVDSVYFTQVKKKPFKLSFLSIVGIALAVVIVGLIVNKVVKKRKKKMEYEAIWGKAED